MKSKKKKGIELENKVAKIYRQIGAKVKQNFPIAGHEIDVYVELSHFDNITTRCGIECKDHQKKIGIKIVSESALIFNELIGLRDIDKGIIISTSGFSPQAYLNARKHRIDLLTLSDLEMNLEKNINHKWNGDMIDGILKKIISETSIDLNGEIGLENHKSNIKLKEKDLTSIKKRKLINLAFDRLYKNSQIMWKYLIDYPIHENAKEIAERKFFPPQLNIIIEEPDINLARSWNILYVGLHSGINNYAYKDLIKYYPDLSELSKTMSEKVFEYYSEMGKLFDILINKLYTNSQDYSKLIGPTAYLFDWLRLEEKDDILLSRNWTENCYNEVLQNLNQLDEIKMEMKVQQKIRKIRKIKKEIGDIQYTIKNIIEYESE